MIVTEKVSKRYGEHLALDDVSFSIEKGEIVGLLGPNGAGKTTLIRMLTGYFEPSAGRITINGVDVVQDPVAVQQLVGYLPEQAPLYPEMLVQEYLDMVADLRGIAPARRRGLLSDAIVATGLQDHLCQPIAQLSRGFRQRVGLAQAILHQPQVLILDEPTSSLDPTQVVQVRALIRELARDATVLFSTHILSEVEQVCERAIILMGGKLRTDARLAELQKSPRAIVAVSESAPGSGRPFAADGKVGPASAEGMCQAFSALDGVTSARLVPGRQGLLTFELVGDADRDLCLSASRLSRQHGWELGELRPVVRDLESVFREEVAS